ncbi:hypothetical protein DMENIID0001_147060 [Sergentomyia squamirostris]
MFPIKIEDSSYEFFVDDSNSWIKQEPEGVVQIDFDDEENQMLVYEITRETESGEDTTLTKKGYKCDNCGKCLSSQFSLDRHVERKACSWEKVPKILQCSICQQNFPYRCKLIEHMNRIHDVDVEEQEDGSFKEIPNNGSLRNTCEICSKTFQTRWHLTRHERVHEVQRQRALAKEALDTRFKCGTCDSSFRSMTTLARHMKSHMEFTSVERDEPIEKISKRKVEDHLRIHKCNHCEKSFTRTCDLHRHMNQTHGIKVKRIKSQGIKPKRIKSQGIKPKRIKIEKSQPKDVGINYQCGICGRSYLHNCHLRHHIRKVHSNGQDTPQPPYKCEICGKGYFGKCDYTLHMWLHANPGQKPYNCAECGKGFTRRENLVTHFSIHRGEQKFECSLCGRKFNRKMNRDVHFKSFHDPTTSRVQRAMIECHVCGKFIQRRGMRLHMKSHVHWNDIDVIEPSSEIKQEETEEMI